MVKRFYKNTTTISEDNIVKQLNPLGDVRVYAKLLHRDAIFVISLRSGAEDST
jgi:hypothetical protein